MTIESPSSGASRAVVESRSSGASGAEQSRAERRRSDHRVAVALG